MAAPGATPIILYHSTTAAAQPSTSNLNPGELAINTDDGKLFYKDSSNNLQVIATKGTGPIGGSTTQVQYNSSGSLAGSANLTFDGSNLKAQSYKETKVTMGSTAIDLSTGNYFSYTVSGTTTFTVTNVPTTGTVASFILDLTNGGSATVNWWTGVKWAGGTAPTLTASGRDVLGFFTYDGGTVWTGLVLGKDVK